MKKLLWASALLVAASLFPSPAKAGCDDNISYAINKHGECVDLTSFTRQGSLERQIADLKRQISPVVLRGLRTEPSPSKENTLVKGEAYNQSRRSVYVSGIVIRFSTMVDGNVKDLGTEEVTIAKTLSPGESVPINDLIMGRRGGSISVDKVDYREIASRL